MQMLWSVSACPAGLLINFYFSNWVSGKGWMELSLPAITILNVVSILFTMGNLQRPKQAFDFTGITFQKAPLTYFLCRPSFNGKT